MVIVLIFPRARAKDMTITIVIINTQTGNEGWSLNDVMPRRDGPENLRILKRVSWDWTIEARVGSSAVEACDQVLQISTDRDLKQHETCRT